MAVDVFNQDRMDAARRHKELVALLTEIKERLDSIHKNSQRISADELSGILQAEQEKLTAEVIRKTLT